MDLIRLAITKKNILYVYGLNRHTYKHTIVLSDHLSCARLQLLVTWVTLYVTLVGAYPFEDPIDPLNHEIVNETYDCLYVCMPLAFRYQTYTMVSILTAMLNTHQPRRCLSANLSCGWGVCIVHP
ncbi:hypothetical protein HanXRQr2_Chr11g0509521 [Helianthus annuus]|uniref:Uncharacterized protein n=1 Tax=Helianthus annuus TaxID=4232 RepID=A0A251TCN9_HELAN|nr:hypothetical protein HanXRQr2_Chr11g0509521 [Helianthus annuus]